MHSFRIGDVIKFDGRDRLPRVGVVVSRHNVFAMREGFLSTRTMKTLRIPRNAVTVTDFDSGRGIEYNQWLILMAVRKVMLERDKA